jgi:hypothetical protein
MLKRLFKITWKGCSEGHYKKYVNIVPYLPEGVTDKEELEEFLSEPLEWEPKRHNWIVKNMPEFVFEYECGTNPCNFHVLKIERISLKKLTNLYDIVKNHPYRVFLEGPSSSYYEALDKLYLEFVKQAKKVSPDKNCTFGRFCWGHQYYSGALPLKRGKKDELKPYREIMEIYISTIHRFLEEGNLNSFRIHFGYINPRDEYKNQPAIRVLIQWYNDLEEFEISPEHLNLYIERLKIKIARWESKIKEKDDLASNIATSYKKYLYKLTELHNKYKGGEKIDG